MGTKPNTRSNSRKPSNNKPGKTSSDFKMNQAKLDNSGRSNDPNWYFTSAEMANQAAQLSFQDVLGNGNVIEDVAIPTMAVIGLNPSPGVSYQCPEPSPSANWEGDRTITAANTKLPTSFAENDGANLMATKIYTLLSTFSGRTQTYGPQDVLTMILAIGEVAAISEHIRRCFGLTLTMNERNRALPKGMLYALGIHDWDDFIQNFADYRMQFNVEMTRINQIPLLDNVGYIRKCRDIYQAIYVDEPTAMAQNFAFVPYSTWVLDEISNPNGTQLTTRETAWYYGSGWTMQTWINLLADQIDALLTSSTLQIVYADLINLSNKVSVPQWKFDYLTENYIVLPQYNRTAILQFHNLDVIGNPVNIVSSATLVNEYELDSTAVLPTGMQVTPCNDVIHDASKNRIVYNPVWLIGPCTSGTGAKTYNCIPHDTIVDMDTDNPSVEDKIEAMRFSAIQSGFRFGVKNYQGYTGWASMLPAISDHYVASLNIFTYPTQAPTSWIPFSTNLIPGGNIPYGTLTDANALEKFAHHPYLYWFVPDPGTSKYVLKYLIGDTDFFTKIDWSYLTRVNRLIFTGLFDFRA